MRFLHKMSPKMMPDEDGDVPPCSVMSDYQSAKEWDAWKRTTHNGKQKAKSIVAEFHPFWKRIRRSLKSLSCIR